MLALLLGQVLHICNLGTWEVEVRVSLIQASLDHIVILCDYQKDRERERNERERERIG